MAKINQKEYDILKELEDKWKWIARDEDLEVYRFKPIKRNSEDSFWDIRAITDEWSVLNSDLFHFIKSEDEEPYFIAKLIEEYEQKEFYDYVGWRHAESEESGVKKDIEWLKSELSRVARYSLNDETIVLSKEDMFNLLDQLDKPEVLSQEWIDGNKEPFHHFETNKVDYYVSADFLQNLLVPKQEENTNELEKEISCLKFEIQNKDNLIQGLQNHNQYMEHLLIKKSENN